MSGRKTIIRNRGMWKMHGMPSTETKTIDKIPSVITEIVNVKFDKNIVKYINTQLKQYDLKLLDQIRDVILHKKGNETLILHGANLDAPQNGSAELKKMFDDLVEAQSNKLGGMLLEEVMSM